MKAFITISLIIFTISTFAQPHGINDSLQNDTVKTKETIIGFPFVFYSPETQWGAGAGAMYAFRFKNDNRSSKPSQIQLGFAYTQRKQFLFYFPFQLYFKNAKYFTYGELGYYIYNYNYYGIGSKANLNDEEIFELKYPRIRITALKKIGENVYFGPRFWLDDIEITKKESGGLLENPDIPGYRGGKASGVGLVGVWDTRDNIFYTSKGEFIELVIHPNHSIFGSDFNFTRYLLNISKFFELPWKHIIATNAHFNFIDGDAPFTQMALLGGGKRMRGFILGRFRDNKMWMLQSEYRIPLKWGFGINTFYGIADVTDNVNDFRLNNTKHAYGLGLRYMIDKEKKLNVRFDVGFTNEGSNFYLTFGEAF